MNEKSKDDKYVSIEIFKSLIGTPKANAQVIRNKITGNLFLAIDQLRFRVDQDFNGDREYAVYIPNGNLDNARLVNTDYVKRSQVPLKIDVKANSNYDYIEKLQLHSLDGEIRKLQDKIDKMNNDISYIRAWITKIPIENQTLKSLVAPVLIINIILIVLLIFGGLQWISSQTDRLFLYL